MDSMLTIAHTGFRISSDMELYYPATAGPINDFINRHHDNADISISVKIQKGGGTNFKDMHVLAETESAWRLLDDGICRWFVSCYEVSEGVPAWAARMDPGGENVSIDCNLAGGNGDGSVPNPLLYPLDQLLLMHILASRRGLIVHGAGIRRGEDAVVFPGVSGAGKTTIAGILDQYGDFDILSDDRVVIREQGGSFRVHGTPWPGEGGFALNESGVLKKICFLKQGSENQLRPLDSRMVFEKIMPVASIPWYDKELMNGAVSFVESLVERVPGYDFVFKKDGSAAGVAESLFG